MCDTLVSLTDEGVLFAKNSDRDPNEAQVLTWQAAATHSPGATVGCTWIEIPQVAHTHAVLLSRPWWMWGAEMGANEHGVVIGNEAVFTDQPHGEPALLGMDLLRLGLERASTADAAVGVIVDLLERHGQGGPCSHARPGFTYHNSFLVADPQGAVVLETAGSRWATERVTGRGRAISNGLTISGFAEAHADRARERVAACRVRRSRTESAATAATDVSDLFAALRDHGTTSSPQWSPLNGALAAPCAHAGGLVTSTQTTSSWVADLRPHGTARHWVTATAAPCTSAFLPVAVDDPDGDLGRSATDRFDPSVRWWRHELVHRLALRDHAAAIARGADGLARFQAELLADVPGTGVALAAADALDDAWHRDLLDAALADRRPWWVRRIWRQLDEAAGIAPTSPWPELVEARRG